MGSINKYLVSTKSSKWPILKLLPFSFKSWVHYLLFQSKMSFMNFTSYIQLYSFLHKIHNKKLPKSFGSIYAWRALGCPDSTISSKYNNLQHTRKSNTNSKQNDLTRNILFHTEIFLLFLNFCVMSQHTTSLVSDLSEEKRCYDRLIYQYSWFTGFRHMFWAQGYIAMKDELKTLKYHS